MIKLVQYMCSQRHCIMAVAYCPEEVSDEAAMADLIALVALLFKTKTLNPWCGLCRSTEFHCEIGVTSFTTLAEARPKLKAAELQQRLTRIAMESARAAENN